MSATRMIKIFDTTLRDVLITWLPGAERMVDLERDFFNVNRPEDPVNAGLAIAQLQKEDVVVVSGGPPLTPLVAPGIQLGAEIFWAITIGTATTEYLEGGMAITDVDEVQVTSGVDTSGGAILVRYWNPVRRVDLR